MPGSVVVPGHNRYEVQPDGFGTPALPRPD